MGCDVDVAVDVDVVRGCGDVDVMEWSMKSEVDAGANEDVDVDAKGKEDVDVGARVLVTRRDGETAASPVRRERRMSAHERTTCHMRRRTA